MPWEPETFTRAERMAAAKAVVHAQVAVDRLDRGEFGSANADVVARAYARIDDLLAMIHEDLYGQASADV